MRSWVTGNLRKVQLIPIFFRFPPPDGLHARLSNRLPITAHQTLCFGDLASSFFDCLAFQIFSSVGGTELTPIVRSVGSSAGETVEGLGPNVTRLLRTVHALAVSRSLTCQTGPKAMSLKWTDVDCLTQVLLIVSDIVTRPEMREGAN
ncbi:unnamed protein product [Protopolystoma xenopodis]|uniref:Uncharacterized protein n=1 Tax=Protopolystoma xenopodis TaxID=117903 RepID=A0A448XS61_9PLAT|nr:unnamed protein product [Protopolystoma xenopodis]